VRVGALVLIHGFSPKTIQAIRIGDLESLFFLCLIFPTFHLCFYLNYFLYFCFLNITIQKSIIQKSTINYNYLLKSCKA